MFLDPLSTDWRTFPNGTRADGQLFVIADLHGRSDLLLETLRQIDALSDPGVRRDRTLVITGDLIDRGPDSFGVIRAAMSAEIGGKPAIILPGNHEGMLLDGLMLPPETNALHFWYRNGGNAVVNQLSCGGRGTNGELGDRLRAEIPMDFLRYIAQAPSHYICGDLLMVHAGLLPPAGHRPKVSEAAFLAQPLLEAPRQHWAWVSDVFLTWRGGWDADRRRVVVHGHSIECATPVSSAEELRTATDRVDSHCRINLDMGGYAFDRQAFLEVIGDQYRIHMVRLQTD